MANVSYTRPEYDDLLPRWEKIKDCIAGSDVIKSKGSKYLPIPNASDNSSENSTRYSQYKERAIFYNVTGRTHKGLLGQVFRKPPEVKLPDPIAALQDDVDGAGVSLLQQSVKVTGDVIAFSRAGLFVDYPTVGGPVSRAMLRSGNIRPTICHYQPWDIINWRLKKVGGVFKLALVVLEESRVTDDDGFEETFSRSYRVLKLDENNLYVQETWIDSGEKTPEGKVKYTTDTIVMPTDARGQRLDYIPFSFVGSVNNDHIPDLPLLYDLSELNIGHYRNSADYEEACFIVGQPTPVLSGLTEDWVDNVLKGKVQVGSRAAIMLPEGGSGTLLQVNPNTMPKEAMGLKEDQMLAIGAKLVDKNGTVERKEAEILIKDFGEHSVLTSISHNVSDAYEKCLAWADRFVNRSGSTGELIFKLNDDFEVHKLDANQRAQLLQEWMSGGITRKEYRNNLRKGGVATEEYDDYVELIDEELPETRRITAEQKAGADQNLTGE